MPNHVTNIIEIKGDTARVKALFEAIKNDEYGLGSIDFNKLVPMPPELDIEEGSHTDRGLKAYQDFIEVYTFNGKKENFDLLFKLAETLGGEVGASRAAVDAGFCEHDRQIGQTGVTVRPKLYIACGISGQIQHIAGMQESSIIISINNDPDAPINTIADFVINGNAEDVIPKLIKYYKKNSK